MLTISDLQNKATTMMWDEQVDKALAGPVANGNFRMMEIILL